MSGAGKKSSETAAPAAPSEDEPLLTSSDLFGDMVDAPITTEPKAPSRTERVRVRLVDPALPAPPTAPQALTAEDSAAIEDLLSHLDSTETPPPQSSPPPQPRVPAGHKTDPDLRPPAAPPQQRPPVKIAFKGTTEFGPYTLLERVAVGGMAEVFKATRRGVAGFEKVVALKRILPHLSDNKEFVDMFVDEAKMVAGLNHPNIVQIFDLGEIDRSYYIAMEYVPGRDLRTIQKRAREKALRMPVDLGLRIVSQVCAALEYAHRKKDERGRPMEIVHRDVSPQNILVSFEGDVKLADFGIARAATKAHTTDRGALRGKLLYMSPEQAWGRPLDRRSDLFALGIVLYEMVTETKPFVTGDAEVTILDLVRQCRITPPRELNPRIPEALERVIMKALAREPDERYPDAGHMQRGLERFLRERPPVTSRDVARLLELLFEPGEREGDEGVASAAEEGGEA